MWSLRRSASGSDEAHCCRGASDTPRLSLEPRRRGACRRVWKPIGTRTLLHDHAPKGPLRQMEETLRRRVSDARRRTFRKGMPEAAGLARKSASCWAGRPERRAEDVRIADYQLVQCDREAGLDGSRRDLARGA